MATSSDTPTRRRPPALANALAPSPKLVAWIDRSVSRVTGRYDSPVPAATTPAPASASAASERMPPVMLDRTTVPPQVSNRFIRVDRDYYFASGEPAFRDRGHKLVTASDNVEVVRTLVQIAQARGWDDITVTGSKAYRLEVWRSGMVAGLRVRGYRPTAFDRAKLARDLAEGRQRHEPLVDVAPGLGADAGQAPDTRSPDSKRQHSPGKRNGAREYSGRLVEHGPAPYEFHPHGDPSYYVRVETPQGQRVVWGRDFERALSDAQVQVGESIHIRQTGRKPVTVTRQEVGEDGRVVRRASRQAHRNEWAVDRQRSDEPTQRGDGPTGVDLSRLAADVRRGAAQVASLNQDMRGAVLTLLGAEAFAEAELSNSKQKTAFVQKVKERLEQDLMQGATVPTPRMHSRTRTYTPQHDPEATRTR